jgi:hypothetical protein
MTTESKRFNFFIRNGENAIPNHACPGAKDSNPTDGLTLLWARNPFRGKSNYWQVSKDEARRIVQRQLGYETNRQKKPGKTIKRDFQMCETGTCQQVAQLHVN